MRCGCGGKTKVYDSREDMEKNVIRRRRECQKCFAKFTTSETFLALDAREFNAVPASGKPTSGFGYRPGKPLGDKPKREDNLTPGIAPESSDQDERNRQARRKIEEIRDRKNAGLDD